MAAPVTKIYDLKTIGFNEVDKQLKAIATNFDKIKTAKREAERALSNAKSTDEAKKFREELNKIKIAEAEVKLQRQQMINEQKAANIVRQTELQQQRQKIDANKAEEGSISRIRQAIRELNALVVQRNPTSNTQIDFRGQLLTYDQAISKLKELIAAEQEFRRQFQKDQTLVGEYTTGIVNAFKQMGLDDLIAGQVTKTQQRLNQLNGNFNDLQRELKETQAAGLATDSIEKQMIDNRNEVIKLDTELAKLKTNLRGTGDVGNQITTSISNGFKSLKGQLSGLVFQFIGVQAVINGIQQSFTDTIRLDSLDSSLQAVSQNSVELAVNQKFLADITERLGLEILDTTQAYKNFYAAATQAGIGVEDTREIFESAASAGANLKLSQEQINGVLLAFGQIASKGTVQAEELRGQIGERIPGAFSIAAKAIGVSQQELNKMLEQGQVLAVDFLPKFAKELQRTFGVDTSKRVQGLQANVNRLKNEFTNLLDDNREGLTSFFNLLINGAGILIKLLPLLVAATALYSAEMLRAYVATQLTTKGTILFRLALIAQQAAIFIANTALTAYYGTIALLTGGLTRATAVTRIFSAVLKSFPLGAILTLVGLLAGAFVAFGRTITNTSKDLSDFARRQLALNDITKETNRIADERIGKLRTELGIINSTSTSLDTKREALERLTKEYSEFNGVIENGIINQQKLKEATDKVTEAIELQARVEASAKLSAEKKADVDEVSIIRRRVESEFARQQAIGQRTGIINVDNLTQSERDLLTGGFFGNRFSDAAKSLRRTGKGIQFLPEDFNNLINELKTEENERIKVLQDYQGFQAQSQKDIDNLLKKTVESTTEFEVNIPELQSRIDVLSKEIDSFKGSLKELTRKRSELAKLQAQLDNLLGRNKPASGGRGSRLTGEQKDLQKDIDALRDEELARLNESFIRKTAFERRETEMLRVSEDGKIEIVKERQQVMIRDEEAFLLEQLEINTKAINDKLNLLKGANAEERKQIAQLSLEKIKLEQETNDKIFEIRAKLLKDQLETEVKNTIEVVTRVKEDPTINETDKAQAQLDADKKLLELQIKFNADMDALEKDRNNISKKNAEDRERELRTINQRILTDEKRLLEAQIVDIRSAGNKQQTQYEINFSKLRVAILNNDKLTASQRKKALEKLAALQNFTIISNELAQLNLEFQAIQKLYEKGLIAEEEYLAAKLKLQKKAEEQEKARKDVENAKLTTPSVTNLQELFSDQLSRAFGFDDGSEEARVLADVITQGYNLATQAMNSFYDAERQRIQDSLDIQLERLDMERQQVIARADSQAEIDSIEKQYAQKKKDAERKAGEQLKETRRKEAKIALAVELANIAVQASQYPFPASLIIGAILSGLALGRYAIRVSEINAQKFEKGGQPGEVPTKGGKFGGKSHSRGGTPFEFKGRSYEAEVDELAVIRTKNAPKNKKFKVEGTQMEIASAINRIGGGIDFKPGAKIRKFETGGFLGQSLQAPVFQPANTTFVNTNSNAEIVEQLKEMNQNINNHQQATDRRFDRMEVVQKTSTVSSALRKEVKQNNIGTIA